MLSEFSPVIGRISKKREQFSSSTIQNYLTCIQKHIAGHNPRMADIIQKLKVMVLNVMKYTSICII